MEQFYPPSVKRLIPSATDPAIRPIGVILHVDAGNSYSLYDWFNGPSKGIESHLHLRKDGTWEQYRGFLQEADANYKGNSFILDGERVGFISVETQGFFSGEWNDAQMTEIKTFLEWSSAEYGFPLRRCPDPYDPGVGYHVMWGAPGDWTPAVGKTCPGPDRIRQFENVIVPWMEGTDMAYLTDIQQKQLADLIDGIYAVKSNSSVMRYIIPWFRKLSGLTPEQLAELEESDEIDAVEAKLDAIVAAGGGVPPHKHVPGGVQ